MPSAIPTVTSSLAFPIKRVPFASSDPEIVKLEATFRRFQTSVVREQWREAGASLVITLIWSWVAYATYKTETEHADIFIEQAIICLRALHTALPRTWF